MKPLKNTITKATKECCSTDLRSSMLSYRKGLMKDTHISGECSALAFILQNILPRVINTSMELEAELAVPCIRIDLVMFVTGMLVGALNKTIF